MSIKAETGFSLKDELFNAETLEHLATGLQQAYPKFNKKTFKRTLLAAFPELALKQRIQKIVRKC